jgi:metal-responsive CopG/Arc/MetJ family transcriptional regulator
MATITLSIPDDLMTEMDISKEINWSEVAREAIRIKINQLRMLRAITSRSQLSQGDALELGKQINESLHQRYKDLGV